MKTIIICALLTWAGLPAQAGTPIRIEVVLSLEALTEAIQLIRAQDPLPITRLHHPAWVPGLAPGDGATGDLDTDALMAETGLRSPEATGAGHWYELRRREGAWAITRSGTWKQFVETPRSPARPDRRP